MRKPLPHGKSWKLTFAAAILTFTSFAVGSGIEETHLCDEQYQCGAFTSPFTVGQQYFYSFQLGSTVAIQKPWLEEYNLAEDAGERSINKSGSLIITPLSTCEFLMTLNSIQGEHSSTSLKVAIENGHIHRVCSSSEDSADSETNMLRALASMLQGNFESSSDTIAHTGSLDFVIQNESEGYSLSKYVHCPTNKNKFIAYKLRQPGPVHPMQDLKFDMNELQGLVSSYPSPLTELCDSSSNTQIEHKKGLTVCVIEREDDGWVTSSRCVQSQYSLGHASASLKLAKVGKNGTPPKGLTFYLAGLQQQSNNMVPPTLQVDDVPPEEFLSTLRTSIQALANSEERRGMPISEVQSLISQVKSVLTSNSNRESLQIYFDELITSSSKQSTILFLKMAADEAHNECVMNFLQTALSHDFVRKQIPDSDLDIILHKIFKSMTSLVSINKNSLKFSKFVADLVNEQQNTFSESAKLSAIIMFSKHLDQFCTRMGQITGNDFCLQNGIVQEWIGSTIVNRIENGESFSNKVPYLETFSNFQRYSNKSCKDFIDMDRKTPENVWTVLSCYRKDACNKEGKELYRNLLGDKSVLVNIRIAAFLAMMDCSNENDMNIVGETVKDGESQDDELSAFVKRYFTNRLSNGIIQCLPNFLGGCQPEETALSSKAEHSKKIKITKASNTVLYRKMRNDAFLLETNILYFDEPAMIPQVIIAKLSHGSVSRFQQNGTFVGGWDNAFQVDVYVDDVRSSQTPLSFHLTAVIRFLDEPVLIKELSLSQAGLLQLVQLLQQKLRNNLAPNDIPTMIKQKLLEMVKQTVNFDGFALARLLNGNKFFPTISGMQQNIIWRANGFGRLSFTKGDCSDVILKNEEGKCRLELRPDAFLDGKIYVATGFGGKEMGYLLKSNTSVTFPMDLLLSRNGEHSAKLTVPSSILHILGGNDHILEVVEVAENKITSARMITHMRHVPRPEYLEGYPKTMDIEFRRARNNFTLQVVHPHYEAVLEGGLEPLPTIYGRYSCSMNATHPKTSSFQIGFTNTEDHKWLQAKLNQQENEYLLEAFFKKVKFTNNDTYSGGSYGCRRGMGVLCSWPFCLFCGTEYFTGATVSTPRFKNIKLFEGSLTQIFPDKEISMVLRTGGIPLVKNGEVKVTLKHGNDTRVFQTSRLKDGLDGKLAQLFPAAPQDEENASGDALPESLAVASAEPILAVSFDTEFTSEVLGHGALSAIYTTVSDRTTIVGGGVFYTWKGNDEKLTLFNTIQNSHLKAANVSRDFVSKASLRSSQFPVLNSDLSIHGQDFNTTTLVTRMVTWKPMNLMKGDIRFELIDRTGSDDTIFSLILSKWPDIDVDQTYKVYLPKHLHYHGCKGNIVVKRTGGVLEKAGIEALIGFDHAFEFKYDRGQEGNGNSYKLLTSLLTASGTYGVHQRIDSIQESAENDDYNDLISLEEDELALEKYKYKGTYIFGELSMKAAGLFLARKGREMLPFSKFGIRVNPVGGKEEGHRIIGSETVKENTHNMKFAIKKGDTNLFEIKNEINPSSQVPIKATISLKDFAEVKIHDNSKFTNTRDFHVKAKWLPAKRIVIGKIAFPTSLEEPLYLDFDVSMGSESNMDNPMLKLTSSSSLEFGRNSSVTTENTFQTSNLKWEFGLDSFYVNEEDSGYNSDEDRYVSKNLKNASFSIFYLPPDLAKYSLKLAGLHDSTNRDTTDRLIMHMERPQLTPFHLHLESAEESRYESTPYNAEDESTRNSSNLENFKIIAELCHKDNFLYLPPMLNADFSIEAFGEVTTNTRFHQLSSTTFDHSVITQKGKLECKSKGILLPLCNQINLSYEMNSDYNYNDNNRGPWVVDIFAINEQLGLTDEANLKLNATYDPVRVASEDYDEGWGWRWGIIEAFLSTVESNEIRKNTYNFDFDLQRKDSTKAPVFGVNGTYVFVKIYESLNFFEFSDQLRWSQMDGGRFHIWTNLLNHTTDSNLTSESATFSSQYVSLGDLEGDVEGDSSNITWMELKTMLSSNGFGTIQTLLLHPSKTLAFNEGEMEADLLIRTEFSPLKTFRLLVSHEQSRTENEDDESTKYGALTKLNGNLNGIEVSGMNSLTLAMGKFIGIGEALMGRYRSREGIYEYVTVNAFGLAPSQLSENEGADNLVHFDVSSSWTNADDDDTDLRIVNDVIFTSPLKHVPMIRFAYFENSTDLEVERNGSLLIYRSPAKLVRRADTLRFTDSIISEGLDELSFTQTSLQSISQQIVDDYSSATNKQNEDGDPPNYAEDDHWYDYNFEIDSKKDLQNVTFNHNMKAKWMGFQEKLFYCESSYKKCIDTVESHEDTSNYCNLVMLPLKHVLSLFY